MLNAALSCTEKASDRVDCSYMRVVLNSLGLGPQWIAAL